MLFQYYPTTYGGGQLQSVLAVLESWGVTSALLPFLLIFVLIFAILQRISIFEKEPGKPDRRINGIISFAIAALVVIPHITGTYPPQADPINIINNFLPSVSILLIAIFVVLILLGLVGKKVPTLAIWMVAIVALIILLLVIVRAAFPAFAPEWFVADPNLQATVIAILVVGLIIWFVMREPEEEKPFGKKFAETIKEWFE
jgi:asparagine N-glycosylation enzyme membrane subunit Stt3